MFVPNNKTTTSVGSFQLNDLLEKVGIMPPADIMRNSPHIVAITGAICTTAGAFLTDTILNDVIQVENNVLRLGHPSGIIETKVDLIAGHIGNIKVVRTARLILEGYVYTKNSYDSIKALA